MGFGLLFVGYLLTFAFSIANVYFFADVVGALLMTYALSKLYPHGKRFGYAAIFSAVIAFAGLAMALLSLTVTDGSLDLLVTVLEYVKIAAVLAFHVFLLSAIADIAVYTGLPELKLKAKRNLIIGIIYMVLNAVLTLDIPALADFLPYVYFPVLLYGYVWIVLNAVLLYRCYMWICLEGDEQMDVKQSRFKAVNTVRDKFNSIEDKVFIKKNKTSPDDGDSAVKGAKKKKKKK